MRAECLESEVPAKQVEKELLARTTQSRERELSRGRTRLRGVARGRCAAIPGAEVNSP